ncbi:hypothetical protein ALTBGP9_00076 [Alteromonas macleodii]|nr:hypothetical protein ALT831_00076 [Alteromonas macleodii]CAI3924137.1 hypothetical protein ALTBGP6_00076 [Alteromonas macleodii]CAI3924282.1 hypothetical protein ALTBGP14_00076 [Alteromonas macleodii]CAI3924294.1 hypothetical protein ALTBGP9_00076 [Alteromonas macleodii]VTO37766.1 hypothetical protein ALTBGP6_00076 [Alteromonas macleodii]
MVRGKKVSFFALDKFKKNKVIFDGGFFIRNLGNENAKKHS